MVCLGNLKWALGKLGQALGRVKQILGKRHVGSQGGGIAFFAEG